VDGKLLNGARFRTALYFDLSNVLNSCSVFKIDWI
jgi:hypothetical protein